MQPRFTHQQIKERNQMIVDLFSSANGKELHLNDIAYFLQLTPEETENWLRQHSFGKWISGKNRLCWRGIGKKSNIQISD